MKFNILTGGPIDCLPDDLFENTDDTNWCGVDLGATHLLDHGIIPKLSVGDFDSSTDVQLQIVKQKSEELVYRPLKDDITDTELAIRCLIKKYQPEKIDIYGATGARLDQLLANLFFILKPEYVHYVERIRLIDKWNTISFFLPGNHQIFKNPKMKYLAFVPLTKVSSFQLPDEKYQLEKTNFDYPVSLSSNEFIKEVAHFSFKSGIVMVIQSRDQ